MVVESHQRRPTGPDRDGRCAGHRRRIYPPWWRLDCLVDRSKAQLHLAEVF